MKTFDGTTLVSLGSFTSPPDCANITSALLSFGLRYSIRHLVRQIARHHCRWFYYPPKQRSPTD